jgi:hypothetical protein
MLKSATVIYVQPCIIPPDGCHVVEVCVETDAPISSVTFTGDVLQQQTSIVSWNHWGRARVRSFVVVTGTVLTYSDASESFPIFLNSATSLSTKRFQSVCKIAIAMATHEPDIELLQRQINSIKGQLFENWCCVISDDISSNRYEIADLIAGDSRFTLLPERSSRLGFYRNFEQALLAASQLAPFVALSDQDDSWKPTKLGVLDEAIGSSDLACSHIEVVDRSGNPQLPRKVLKPRSSPDAQDEIVANSVPGMSMLLSPGLIERSLPFPDVDGVFHDHWLTLSALAGSGIYVVPTVLVDYTQHQSNVIGEVKPWAVGRGELKQAVLQHFQPERMSGRSIKSDRPTDLALAELAVQRAGRDSELSRTLGKYNAETLKAWKRALQMKNRRHPLGAGEAHLFSWKLQQDVAQSVCAKERQTHGFAK